MKASKLPAVLFGPRDNTFTIFHKCLVILTTLQFLLTSFSQRSSFLKQQNRNMTEASFKAPPPPPHSSASIQLPKQPSYCRGCSKQFLFISFPLSLSPVLANSELQDSIKEIFLTALNFIHQTSQFTQYLPCLLHPIFFVKISSFKKGKENFSFNAPNWESVHLLHMPLAYCLISLITPEASFTLSQDRQSCRKILCNDGQIFWKLSRSLFRL